MDYNLPVGFRFHPTEEELIHYLKRKLEGDVTNIIPEIELCNVEPSDIPAATVIKTDEPVWFFFSPLVYKKTGRSGIINRETKGGYWKITVNNRVIKKTGTNNVIGTMKALRFCEGSRKNVSKTDWAMHEYHAAATSDDAHQRKFVLRRLIKTAEKKNQWANGASICDKGEPSRHMASDCKNKTAKEGIPDVHDHLPEVNTDSIVRTWHQEQSYNANSRNENSSRQTPFEYTEGITDVRAEASMTDISRANSLPASSSSLFPLQTANTVEEKQTAMDEGKRIFLILDYIPVGFRFHPTDEELIGHYLKRKLQGDDTSVINIIPVIDLCNFEPCDIPALSLIKTDEPEWFFFCPIPLDYKYASSNDPDSKQLRRATRFGYWKFGGFDRVIKETGTNNVIGYKKILAFKQGDIHSFKTNWVMHEYHAAATLDNVQRNFVLCRLMNKAEEKTQWGTGALTCDKGETSRHVNSERKNKAAEEGIPDVHGILPEVNMDSIFGPWRQNPFQYTEGITDEYEMNEESILQIMDQEIYPSTQQSRIIFDEEVFLPELPSDNAYFRIENSISQAPVEITEEEVKFLNSLFSDGKSVITEKRRNAFVKNSTQPESLRMVYYESSDTDAEVVSALCFNIVDTSTVHGEHPSSGEYHASKMYKSSHGVKASSCDSTADKALKINGIENSGRPRRWKYQYHAKPFKSQRAAARYQCQPRRKLLGNAVSNLEVRKPSSCTRKMEKPEKDHVIARNSSSREKSETRNHQSSNANRIGSFICAETRSSCQSLFLRSAYLVNIVLGVLWFMLFIVISWELLPYLNCC